MEQQEDSFGYKEFAEVGRGRDAGDRLTWPLKEMISKQFLIFPQHDESN
jgi:hypothetical protein